jgi:glucan phosphoethanolaminetransferase (alkaline phosphatase superfamily)
VFEGFTFAAIYDMSFSEMMISWQPLIMFVIGMALYSIFIFKFYRFLARVEIFHLDINEYDMHPKLKKTLHILEYVILFPVVVFFWFLIMSVLLTMVSSSQTISEILFLSVAFVSSVRAVSYYSENLSRELAKLVPFTIMAIFLIEGASELALNNTVSLLEEIPGQWVTLVYYLLFVIVLEFVMRMLTHKKRHCEKKKKAAGPAMTEHAMSEYETGEVKSEEPSDRAVKMKK